MKWYMLQVRSSTEAYLKKLSQVLWNFNSLWQVVPIFSNYGLISEV